MTTTHTDTPTDTQTVSIAARDWLVIQHFITGLAMGINMTADGRVATAEELEAILRAVNERNWGTK